MPLTSRPVFSDLKFRHLPLLPLSGCSPPPQLLKMAIIRVISFPKEWGSQIILLSLLRRSCQVPSSLLCRNVWRYLRCALLSQVERNGLRAGVSISAEPALPGLIASSHSTTRGSQAA